MKKYKSKLNLLKKNLYKKTIKFWIRLYTNPSFYLKSLTSIEKTNQDPDNKKRDFDKTRKKYVEG